MQVRRSRPRLSAFSARQSLFVFAVAIAALIVLAIPPTPLAASRPSLVGSVSNSTNLSGVTAIAVAGNYAYSAGYYGGTLTAVDVSSPAQPLVAGQSITTNNLLNASTVNIVGGYAYVVSKNRNGPNGSNSNDDGTGNSFTILDIASNPAQPTVVGSVRDPVNLFGAYGVAVSGNYAFVAAQGCLSGQPCPNPNVGDAFVVIDISTPSNPTIVATLKNSNLAAPWTGSGALRHVTSVALSGSYAYVTAAYSNRLTVIDISNPLSPQIVASRQDSNRLDFPVDVNVTGGYAYVADQGTGTGRLAVVDVHDPTAPQIVGLVDNTNTQLNGAYRVRVRGNFAYVAASSAAAVSAIDISNPTAPRVADYVLDTAHLNRTTGLDVDPSGRYLIASSPHLSTQSQVLYPPFPPQQGAPTLTGTVSAIDLDPAPISVTIAPSSEPPNPTTQAAASFTFSTSDAVATVRCQLDGAPFAGCTTPTSQTYSSLSPGPHTFTVQASDAAGNTATDTYSWTINTSPPANTSPPTVSGSAVEGETLTGSAGTWTGSPAPTFAYQWQRCDSGGDNCAAIAGATSSTYPLVSADVGSTIVLSVIASNSAGSGGPVASTHTAVVSPATPPVTPVLDTFDRPNGSAGANWSLIRPSGLASMNILGNAAVDSSTSSFAWNYWKPATFGPDCEGYVTISKYVAGDVVRIGARIQNAGTTDSGYYVSVSATGLWSIIRIDKSSLPVTLAAGPTQPLASGDRIGIRIVGSVITALRYTTTIGWQQVLAYDTANNTTRYTTAGNLALEFKTSTVDEFGGGTLVAPSPPANTSPPTVSGSAVEGQTLTGSAGTWTGSPAPTFAYQWQRCNFQGGGCTDLPFATSSSYTAALDDVGSTLLVVVTASNSAGSASMTSAVVGPVTAAATAPQNTSPPDVTGTAQEGETLTGSAGTWTGSPAPTFAYQWQRCDSSGGACVEIGSATSSAYTLTTADVGSTIVLSVTASNSAGSANMTSAVVGPVAATTPQNTSPPVVSGTPQEGLTLTASTGSWTGTPSLSFAYQWQRCDFQGGACTDLPFATGSSYTAGSVDVDSTLRVVVTASNSAGSASAASAATGPVATAATPPQNTSPPVVSGTPQDGQMLAASPGTWSGNPAPTFAYQWQRCDSSGASCVDISSPTGSSYTAGSVDVDSTLLVVVTASNSAGSASMTSAPVGPVAATTPQNTSPPVVSGTPQEGLTLTASTGSWTGTPSLSFAYQWQRCDSSGASCVDISSATGSSYTAVLGDVGSTLRVVVTASNSAGSASAASAATGPVAGAATAPQNTSPPDVTGTSQQGQTLTASAGSWSGIPAPTFAYQWQRCNSSGASCVDISSATGSSYTAVLGDVGSTLRVVVTASNSAGSANMASAVVGPVAAAQGPLTPLLDGFNRANGPVGSNWGLVFGGFVDFAISSNELVDPSPGTYAWDYWKAQQFGPASEAYVTVKTTSADAIRVCARMTNPSSAGRSGYCVHVVGGSWTIRRIDNGTATTLGATVTQALTAGDRISIAAIGSVISSWYYSAANGTWTQLLSRSDSTYAAGGYLALESRASHLDNFGGGTIP